MSKSILMPAATRRHLPHGRQALFSFCLQILLACQYNGAHLVGPMPVPTTVFAVDIAGTLVPATSGVPLPLSLQQSLSAPIAIVGTGFSPLVTGALTGKPAVVLPTVALHLPNGARVPLAGVEFLTTPAGGQLRAEVPAQLPLGIYDLEVTNANGRSAVLAHAILIVKPPGIDLCSNVVPSFGWLHARTTLEICANNANKLGLQPVPQVFLQLGVDGATGIMREVALIRATLIASHIASGGFSDASLMSAVVPSLDEPRGAGLTVGGPYDLRVLNPDGSQAILAKAFTVLPTPPPSLTALAPEQISSSQNVQLLLTGLNLKDPSAALSPRLANVWLLAPGADTSAGCVVTAGCTPCANPAFVTGQKIGTQVSCAVTGSSLAPNRYLVRYVHLDDKSYVDLAAFTVTNPAANLASTTALPAPLIQARFAHGAVTGQDDLQERFIYAIGGQSAAAVPPSSALASVEVARLTLAGDLNSWRSLPVQLPQATTGLSALAYGGYLFTLGGNLADGSFSSHVYRAQILTSATQPVLAAPALQVGGSLAPGVYSYRVAAIMATTDLNNPAGESLPADAETIRTTSVSASVQLSWAAIPGAASYTVFRSPTPNLLADNEVVLATGIAAAGSPQFLDTGIAAAGKRQPQPSGATGTWVPMPSLTAGRADAAATLAVDPSGGLYLYMLGGRQGSSITASYEYAPLSQTNGIWSLGSFVSGTVPLPAPRAEAVATLLDPASAPVTASQGGDFVVVAQGTSGTSSYSDFLAGGVTTGGQISKWCSQAASNSDSRQGAMGALVNSVAYTVGGLSGNSYLNSGRSVGVTAGGSNGACSNAATPVLTLSGGNAGFSLAAARYRGALVYRSGYFYTLGGLSGPTQVEASVDRTGY